MPKETSDMSTLTREQKLAILRAPLPEITIQPHRTWGGCITDRRTMIDSRRRPVYYFDEHNERG